MTREQVIKEFWQQVNTDRKLLRQKNKRDLLGMHTFDIRNAFMDFIEGLRSRGEITIEIANTINLNDE